MIATASSTQLPWPRQEALLKWDLAFLTTYKPALGARSLFSLYLLFRLFLFFFSLTTQLVAIVVAVKGNSLQAGKKPEGGLETQLYVVVSLYK